MQVFTVSTSQPVNFQAKQGKIFSYGILSNNIHIACLTLVKCPVLMATYFYQT